MEEKEIINNPVKHSGLIVEPVNGEDYIVGAYSPLVGSYEIIMPQGHGWLNLQRPEERQFNYNFDSYSCVSFASLKALSYYFKAKLGIDYNFSERFTSKMSGTIPGTGNSVRNVLESIRKQGFLFEPEYPFAQDLTQAQFFAPIRGTLTILAEGRLQRWKINWESLSTVQDVDHEQIKAMLAYSPIIVTGYAWASYLGEGVYKDYKNQANHCFLIADYDNNQADWDLLADDSYPQDTGDGIDQPQEFLKKLSKDYRIWSAHRIVVEEIETPQTDLTLLNKIKMAFKKLARDCHGGLWFIKKLSDGTYGKAPVNDFKSLSGALIDEVGCEKNNLTDAYMATLKDYPFFG